ncbi:MAG: hypothetical protein ABSD58_06170 [Verrucomicrobiia bacterium]|jgi:hypothetical protein
METVDLDDKANHSDLTETGWSENAPRGGRTVLGRILKEGATVPMFLGQTLINSLRDLGYNHTTSAVCEHVDNGIQWKATDIRVYFNQHGNHGDSQVDILILDNGMGNHLAGRRQKMRRRLRILEKIAATSTSADRTSAQRASSLESLNIIRNSVTPSQWQLLMELATGNSYRELSADRGSPVGTNKSSICRLRKRLRKLVFEDDSIGMAI